MKYKHGSERRYAAEKSPVRVPASEAIATDPEATKVFARFEELCATSRLWPGGVEKKFNYTDLEGATESGKLFHLWRSNMRTANHEDDFLLVVGDIHTGIIAQSTITSVTETKDGDGAAMFMAFTISGVRGSEYGWLRLSRTECVLGTVDIDGVDHEEDHIMPMIGMKLARERYLHDRKKSIDTDIVNAYRYSILE